MSWIMPDDHGHPTEEEMDFGAILSALADPLRRAVVVALAVAPEGTERHCSSFGLPVAASTRTHHFRILREAGLVRQVDRGNARLTRLRRAELDRRFPGLLRLVVDNAPPA
ncbi:ArsR/SmtB family transcription factor [Nocardia terpenica]|nr:transcriptional regulator [Nocardia terpenica]